ncbi:hypothetical protein ACLMJK_008225 [Lecanora helva]
MAVAPTDGGMLILSLFMAALTGSIVLLRFLIRMKSKIPLAADDWWVLISLTLFWGTVGAEVWFVTQIRRHPEPEPELVGEIRKMIYAVSFLPGSTTAAAKLSFLCLYRRLFPVELFRRQCSVVKFFVVLGWGVYMTGFYLQCRPINAAWDPDAGGAKKQCINIAALFLGFEIFSCVLDVVMIVLPVGMVRGLRMPRGQKVAVGSIFCMGGLVLIAAIIRMATVYRAGESTLPLDPNINTTTAENGLHIVCACFPILGPVITYFKNIFITLQQKCHHLRTAATQRRRRRGNRDSIEDGLGFCRERGSEALRTGDSGSSLNKTRASSVDMMNLRDAVAMEGRGGGG